MNKYNPFRDIIRDISRQIAKTIVEQVLHQERHRVDLKRGRTSYVRPRLREQVTDRRIIIAPRARSNC